MLKAPMLKRGDTIGIVSPSWGGAGLFPHRLEQGIRQLTALGFKVTIGAHALHRGDFVSDTPENRARDIHDMCLSPEVAAVIAAIGGDHSCHLLPWLDFDLIRRNPKIFVGYSDITVLNVAIWRRTGLVTFNGPALLTDFAEHPRMLAYTQDYFLRAVASADPIGVVAPSPGWTEEFLAWDEKQDLQRPREMRASPGWTWLKGGTASGPLVGGCLESLEHLRGTEYWPDWDGAIFFFETSEEKPSPERVDAMLMDYENMGVLERLSGMIVGRPMRYTDDEKQRLRERILERTERYTFPIVIDMDFGHTAPQLTLPLGCQARIDTPRQQFEIIEPAVVA